MKISIEEIINICKPLFALKTSSLIDNCCNLHCHLSQYDAVYVSTDGEMRFVVAEAKYSANMNPSYGMTNSGKQMSISWIDERLKDALESIWNSIQKLIEGNYQREIFIFDGTNYKIRTPQW